MLASLAGVPGVVRALALEENAGLPLLVLDDAGPITLGEWLERKPLELAAFLPLALRMAETVAALHARGVVHRDVNPRNVVLDAGGEHPTLVDFGTATTLAGVSPDADALAGTLGGHAGGHAAVHGARADRAHGAGGRPPGGSVRAGRDLLPDVDRRAAVHLGRSGGAGARPPGPPAGAR